MAYVVAMKTDLKITGMTCSACVGHVQRALASVPGVQSVEVDLGDQRATVEHDQVETSRLIGVVEEEGYGASVNQG